MEASNAATTNDLQPPRNQTSLLELLNVDYLLDQREVELVAFYLIRSRQELEATLGKLIELEPAAVRADVGHGL